MYSNILKKTPLIAVTIIAIGLAVVGPVLSTNNASAAGSSRGGANGFLAGAVGTVTCPDGSTIGGASASFNATQGPDPHYIMIIAGIDDRIEGAITQVHVTSNQFQFTGTGEHFCPSPNSDPITISMKGQCGSRIMAKYQAENGEKGTLGPIDVNCNP